MCVPMKEFNWSDSTQGRHSSQMPQLPNKTSMLCVGSLPQVAGQRCPRDPPIASLFSLPIPGHRQSHGHIAARAWKKSLMLMLDFPLPPLPCRALRKAPERSNPACWPLCGRATHPSSPIRASLPFLYTLTKLLALLPSGKPSSHVVQLRSGSLPHRDARDCGVRVGQKTRLSQGCR